MTDTEQKLREAFESRMTDNGKWPRAIEKARSGCYLLAQTENAWAEWQACAEALSLPTQAEPVEGGEVVVPIKAPTSVGWVLDSYQDGNYTSLQEAWRDILTAAGAEAATPPASQEQAEPAAKEPVAWMLPRDGDECAVFREPNDFAEHYSTKGWTPLYTTPQPATASAELPDEREAFEAWFKPHSKKVHLERCGDSYFGDWAACAWEGWQARAALSAQAVLEPARPDIIERLSYHALERDDLTLDDCLDVLASGWKKVRGRTERQMVMQMLALLAGQAAQAAPDGRDKVDAERYRWLLANYARGDGYDNIDAALNDGDADTKLSQAIDAAIAARAKGGE